MISICEVSVAALIDKFGISRKKAVSIYCIVGIICGTIFATQSGLLVLDIVDHFIMNFGVLICGLVEILFLTWFCRLTDFQEHINRTSDFAVGNWWVFCLKIITPVVLFYMSIQNLIGDIKTPYENYPASALFWFGWVYGVRNCNHKLCDPDKGFENNRRKVMTISALIMMAIGLGVTWGGVAVCITIAVKKKGM